MNFGFEKTGFLDWKSYSRADFADYIWKRPNKIALISQTAVGKTTLVKRLLKTLPPQFHFQSGGAIMRQKADEFLMTIEQFTGHNRMHPEDGYDRMCDEMMVAVGEKHPCIVTESRLGNITLPQGFHVFLECPMSTRAERRLRDLQEEAKRKGEECTLTFEDVLSKILMRDVDDSLRYDELYPGWSWDEEDYDLVLDTGVLSFEEEEARILDSYEQWAKRLQMKECSFLRQMAAG